LVVGGGFCGCIAAIRAKELNADVLLVDKNFVGKTSGGYFAGDLMLFNEDWGDDLNAWLEQFSRIGEYVADRSWTELLLKESYSRYRDLVSWGIPFIKMDGTSGFPPPGEEPKRILGPSKYRKTTLISKFGTKYKLLILRKKLLESGGKIRDRVVITDLLKQGERVVGAVGFNTVNGDFYAIKAKAVVVAAGGLSFKGTPYATQFDTGDSVAMGYRAGAELISMEFGQYAGRLRAKDASGHTLFPTSIVINAKGEDFLGGGAEIPSYILWLLEVHAGRGPIYSESYGVEREKIKEALNMALTGTFWMGGLRFNTKCETNVPGLYAAGDASGSNFTGAAYAALGSAMCLSAVTGYRAGQSATEFALKAEKPSIPESEVAKCKDAVYAPLMRESGFTTDHVLTRVQQTILPYEVRMVMHEKRLQAAITMIEFYRDHFLPKMRAVDPHDLRNAHEVRNMVLGAEMMLRAALFRTESRGSFYREDYPRRDDENWLKWVVLKEDAGKMKLWTEPVPKEYWGDTSMPYGKRYPLQYPE